MFEIFKKFSKKKDEKKSYSFPFSYYSGSGISNANRDFGRISDEAYLQNVIAYMAVNKIAICASGINLQVLDSSGDIVADSALNDLLERPNVSQSQKEFFIDLISYYALSGNSYILQNFGVSNDVNRAQPIELEIINPAFVTICQSMRNTIPESYRVDLRDGTQVVYPVDQVTGMSQIIHVKSFNPAPNSKFIGTSSASPSSRAIDSHNEASEWNLSLLRNGARSSGAIVAPDGMNLSDEQFNKLRQELEQSYSGASNAGRPMLLEGGLDFKEMSLSPKDMDFINSQSNSARDIARAFGVPPVLLGLPGDSTYNNQEEANQSFYDDTVIPTLALALNKLNMAMSDKFGGLTISFDKNEISALLPRRRQLWEIAESSSFLTINEKRELVGFAAVDGGDVILTSTSEIPLGFAETDDEKQMFINALVSDGLDEAVAKSMADLKYVETKR